MTARKLQDLYGAPSGDASHHFVGRDKVVPKGRRAAWTHFVWQLAAWSGERYLATGGGTYRTLHDRFFSQGLALFTGEREVSVGQEKRGAMRVIAVPRLRMPECYIADTVPNRGEIIFPSPHTPLNWATGEMLGAFGVRNKVLVGK